MIGRLPALAASVVDRHIRRDQDSRACEPSQHHYPPPRRRTSAWWAPRSSKPVGGRKVPGGFDSRPPPPTPTRAPRPPHNLPKPVGGRNVPGRFNPPPPPPLSDGLSPFQGNTLYFTLRTSRTRAEAKWALEPHGNGVSRAFTSRRELWPQGMTKRSLPRSSPYPLNPFVPRISTEACRREEASARNDRPPGSDFCFPWKGKWPRRGTSRGRWGRRRQPTADRRISHLALRAFYAAPGA